MSHSYTKICAELVGADCSPPPQELYYLGVNATSFFLYENVSKKIFAVEKISSAVWQISQADWTACETVFKFKANYCNETTTAFVRFGSDNFFFSSPTLLVQLGEEWFHDILYIECAVTMYPTYWRKYQFWTSTLRLNACIYVEFAGVYFEYMM